MYSLLLGRILAIQKNHSWLSLDHGLALMSYIGWIVDKRIEYRMIANRKYQQMLDEETKIRIGMSEAELRQEMEKVREFFESPVLA